MRHAKILMIGTLALGLLNGCNKPSSGNARRPAATKVDCTVPNPPAECNSNAIPGGSTTTTVSCETQTTATACASVSGCNWNGLSCVSSTPSTTTPTPTTPVVTQPTFCTPLTTASDCAAAGCSWDGSACKIPGLPAAPQPTSCTSLNTADRCAAGGLIGCTWNGTVCTRPGVNTGALFAVNDGLSHVGSTNVPGQNCNFSALFRSDGNFVVFQGTNAIWSTATSGKGATRAQFQADGNFVIAKDSAPAATLFNTATNGKSATSMVLGKNGNLVILNSSGTLLWDSKTSVVGCY